MAGGGGVLMAWVAWSCRGRLLAQTHSNLFQKMYANSHLRLPQPRAQGPLGRYSSSSSLVLSSEQLCASLDACSRSRTLFIFHLRTALASKLPPSRGRCKSISSDFAEARVALEESVQHTAHRQHRHRATCAHRRKYNGPALRT